MAAAEALAATRELGGIDILAPRLSESDPRPRHRGVSHHTDDILSVWRGATHLAWPRGCPIEHPVAGDACEVDVDDWREACDGLPLAHMGRGPDDDPWFFAAAFAAGRHARGFVS